MQKWDDFLTVANDYLLALNKAGNKDYTNYRYSYYKSVFQKGFLTDLDGARRLMKSIDSIAGTTSGYDDQFNQLNLLDNDYGSVIEDLKPLQKQYFYFYDCIFLKSLLLGQVYLYAHKIPESEDQFNAAVAILSSIKKGNEDDFRWHQSLGLAYAGLGKKSEAINEGNPALHLIVGKDAEGEVTSFYRAMIDATLAIQLPAGKNNMTDLCIAELSFLPQNRGCV